MPKPEQEIDVNFFRLIHQIVSSHKDGSSEDRRAAQRNRYPGRQSVAPWDGEGVPAAWEFVPVQCHDLTRRGFSFLLPDYPAFKRLVVRFEGAGQVIYAGAEVVRTARVWVLPSGSVKGEEEWAPGEGLPDGDGERARPMVLLGCQLIRRLEKPLQQSMSVQTEMD